MPNFTIGDTQSIRDFITTNLPRHKQFALATTDDEGHPWVVCLNLAYDDQFNIIWKSERDTVHSQQIAMRPEVAICVFSEIPEVGDFGFYAQAVAHEVTDRAELARLLAIRYARRGEPMPPIENFLGDASSRIYYATLTAAWVNDDRHVKAVVM